MTNNNSADSFSGDSPGVASFLCRKDGTFCGICGKPTEIGEEIYPIATSLEGDVGKLQKWCHVACYLSAKMRDGVRIDDVEKKERPLCKHFVLHGKCRYGDKCFFSHDEAKAAEKRAALALA